MPKPPQPEAPPHSTHHSGSVATRYARGERPFLWPPMPEGPVEPTIEPNYEQEEIDRLAQINEGIGRLELVMQKGLELPPIDIPAPIVRPLVQPATPVDLGPLLEMLGVLSNQFAELRTTIETRVGQDRQPSVVYGGGARQVGLLDILGNKITPAQEPSPQVGTPLVVTAAGDTLLFAGTSKKQTLLRWLAAKTTNATATVVSCFFVPSGSTSADPAAVKIPPLWSMDTSDVYSHTTKRLAPIGFDLVLNLSIASSVYCDFDCEVIG